MTTVRSTLAVSPMPVRRLLERLLPRRFRHLRVRHGRAPGMPSDSVKVAALVPGAKVGERGVVPVDPGVGYKGDVRVAHQYLTDHVYAVIHVLPEDMGRGR
jgi:hypothetical protein